MTRGHAWTDCIIPRAYMEVTRYDIKYKRMKAGERIESVVHDWRLYGVNIDDRMEDSQLTGSDVLFGRIIVPRFVRPEYQSFMRYEEALCCVKIHRPSPILMALALASGIFIVIKTNN